MNNLYRVLLIVLLLILLMANITFFAYNSQFMAYFKLDSVLETPEEIINKTRNNNTGEAKNLDLSVLESEKFNNLKDFKVDTTGLELPDDIKIIDGETGEPVDGEEKSEFEIGNQNPFAPSF